MNSNVLKAILALDSYNRGYGASINMLGDYLGTTKILIDSSDISLQLNDQASGFYGIAYQLTDGEKVISYRGTDEIAGDGEIGNDIWNEWFFDGGSFRVKAG